MPHALWDSKNAGHKILGRIVRIVLSIALNAWLHWVFHEEYQKGRWRCEVDWSEVLAALSKPSRIQLAERFHTREEIGDGKSIPVTNFPQIGCGCRYRHPPQE